MNTRSNRCHVTLYATRQPRRRRYCATVIARKSPSVRMPNRRQCSRAKWVAAATYTQADQADMRTVTGEVNNECVATL